MNRKEKEEVLIPRYSRQQAIRAIVRNKLQRLREDKGRDEQSMRDRGRILQQEHMKPGKREVEASEDKGSIQEGDRIWAQNKTSEDDGRKKRGTETRDRTTTRNKETTDSEGTHRRYWMEMEETLKQVDSVWCCKDWIRPPDVKRHRQREHPISVNECLLCTTPHVHEEQMRRHLYEDHGVKRDGRRGEPTRGAKMEIRRGYARGTGTERN